MKHLEIEQLKLYAERHLSAAETMRIIRHLDECPACFDSFQKQFPTHSDTAREVSAEILADAETEHFHLDYDEHLKPFIDSEADAATREIVENHLQHCSLCAQAVRDLREFSDGLRIRETPEKTFAENPPKTFSPKFFSSDFNRLSLLIIAVLIFGVSIWLLFRQPETPRTAVENQTANRLAPISASENAAAIQPKISNDSTELNLNSSLRTENAEIKKSNAENRKDDESKSSDDEKLLASLPADLRVSIEKAVQTQKIVVPSFINDLRENNKSRSTRNGEKNIALSPDGQAVRAGNPNFTWRKFAADDDEYVVTIFDNNFNRVAVSPNLRGLNWQSNTPLKRGKIYRWQVQSIKTSKFFTARFKVLDEKSLERLKKIETVNHGNPLWRAIVYASEGLLKEADAEFQKEIKKRTNGNLAEKLRNSLRKNR